MGFDFDGETGPVLGSGPALLLLTLRQLTSLAAETGTDLRRGNFVFCSYFSKDLDFLSFPLYNNAPPLFFYFILSCYNPFFIFYFLIGKRRFNVS